MKILITGGAGFIGSHLVQKLLEQNFFVSVIDNLSTGRRENISPCLENPKFQFCHDSIFNYPLLDSLVAKADLVFHLAAAVGVKLIVEDPIRTIETNILGTEAVLQSSLKHRKKILIASTSEVYGKSEQIPFSEENDLVLGSTTKSRWAYAASKMIDEFLALAYFKHKELPVVLMRFFNTIGPRQSAQYGMVVPRFVQQAIRNEKLTVYGDGEQTRCFCDVEDVVEAMMKLMEPDRVIGEVFNIGSNEEISVNELARKVIHLVDPTKSQEEIEQQISHLPYQEVYPEGFEEIRTRRPDIQKIREFVGWKSKTSLEETLRKIIKSKSSTF